MKKKFTISLTLATLLYALFLSPIATAQEFGLNVGTNFSNFHGDDAISTSTKFNLTIGAYYEIRFSDVAALQPELIWSGQGAKIEEDIMGEVIEFKQKMSYLNLPVPFKYYLGDKFYLQAGPYLGLLMSAKLNVSGSLGALGGENKDDFKSMDFGALAGMGVILGKFRLSTKYQMGISNIAEAAGGDLKNNLFNINLGFALGGE